MAKKSKTTQHLSPNTLKYWYDQKKNWLNPEYQKESVGTTYQKQILVDSMLHDINMSKLYFRRIDKDQYEYEVVDGQQRLRSIFKP